MSTPLFGLIPTGHPLLTDPSSTPSPTSTLYTISAARPFSHLTVFLLPGVELPPNTAAAIYYATAQAVARATSLGQTPDFQFLGGVGPGKESAVFKIGASALGNEGFGAGGVEGGGTNVMIGISIEDASSVAARIQEKATNAGGAAGTATQQQQQQQQQPGTAVLAQRIIQNAFNFLSGFSGSAGPGGVEVVPLKAFEEWWKKFESRVRSDPSFLERAQE